MHETRAFRDPIRSGKDCATATSRGVAVRIARYQVNGGGGDQGRCGGIGGGGGCGWGLVWGEPRRTTHDVGARLLVEIGALVAGHQEVYYLVSPCLVQEVRSKSEWFRIQRGGSARGLLWGKRALKTKAVLMLIRDSVTVRFRLAAPSPGKVRLCLVGRTGLCRVRMTDQRCNLGRPCLVFQFRRRTVVCKNMNTGDKKWK